MPARTRRFGLNLINALVVTREQIVDYAHGPYSATSRPIKHAGNPDLSGSLGPTLLDSHPREGKIRDAISPIAAGLFMNLKHVCLLALNLVGFPALAADLQIASFSSAGSLIIKNGYPQGVVTVMSAPALTGPWAALKNSFTVGLDVPVSFSPPSATTFYRALAVDLSGVDSWLFTFADIVDLGACADRVGAFADGVSVYLANNLSVSTQDLLSEY